MVAFGVSETHVENLSVSGLRGEDGEGAFCRTSHRTGRILVTRSSGPGSPPCLFLFIEKNKAMGDTGFEPVTSTV